MTKRGEYSVRISGLKDGEHEFSFEIGNTFFKLMDHPDISGGSVKAKIDLSKKQGLMTLSFHLEGLVETVCDRCLDFYPQHIEVNEIMVVKFGEDPGAISENIIFIRPEEHEIRMDQYLLEFIVLALPLKKVHPDNEKGESGCNREMIKKLKEHLVNEENKTQDPRWDELKRFIAKNN